MVHFFVHRGLKTKELLKNTKNITFTSTIKHEKTFANNSKFKIKNSNTKEAKIKKYLKQNTIKSRKIYTSCSFFNMF